MRYLIHFDAPIMLHHKCADDMLTMAEHADIPINWTKTAERTVDSIRRLYYASCAPFRTLVVMRNGVDIRRLNMGGPQAITYATALVGWDDGTQGYVRPEDAGKRHTKITIDVLFTLTPDGARANAREAGIEIIEWSDLLRNVPRSDRPGGYRGTQGRTRIDQSEPTVRLSASVPASYRDAVKRLGNGDISAGVRAAIEATAPPRSETVTITSRKAAEHEIDPPIVEIGGREWMELGSGYLANIVAAYINAGMMDGEVEDIAGTLYWHRPGGYDDVRTIVMIK